MSDSDISYRLSSPLLPADLMLRVQQMFGVRKGQKNAHIEQKKQSSTPNREVLGVVLEVGANSDDTH